MLRDNVAPYRLSQEATRFLREYVKTAVNLDVLMVLFWDNTRQWGVHELATRLQLGPFLVAKGVMELSRESLVARAGGEKPTYYFQAPTDYDLSMRLHEVAVLYRADRASVVDLLATEARSFAEPKPHR